MRPWIITALAAFALATITGTSLLAQNGHDGGLITAPNQAQSQAPQRAGGMMGPAQETSACAHFRSFDPASNTYMGRDGRRHACQM